MASEIIKNPPQWAGIDSREANKWIDENIRPIAENVDDFFQVIIGFEQFLQEILDFAITFLQGIKNPLIALIQALIDALRAIINDLSQAGFYFTLDSVFKDPSSLKEIGKFEGGYSRFRKELTEKLTNPKDLGRPNFSELTGLLTITAYASADVEDWIKAYKSIVKFLQLFQIDRVSSYPPPRNITTGFYKSYAGLKLEVTPKEIDVTQPPEGLLLKWSLPSAKKTPLFPDIKAPPDYFLVTISTRATPLMIVTERNVSSSTSPNGMNTVVEPIYLSDKKTEIATTLLLSEVFRDGRADGNRLKYLLKSSATELDPEAYNFEEGKYKIYATDYINSPMKINLMALKDETYSFLIETGTFGVIFTGSDYKEEFSYRNLPKKLYDVASKRHSEEITKYYVSISSLMGDGRDLEDVLNPALATPQYFDSALPSFSIPVEHTSIGLTSLKYISSLREVLTRFLVFEKTMHSTKLSVMSEFYSLDPRSIERVYSLFKRSSKNPLFKENKSNVPDKYVGKIKEEVDSAIERVLERGLPELKEIERMQDEIDYFNRGQLTSDTDFYFYKSLSTLKNAGDDGIYKDLRLGDSDTRRVASRKEEKWFVKGVSRSFNVEGDTLTSEDKGDDSTPLFKKGNVVVYPVLKEDFYLNFTDILLSIPSKKKEIADGESEWYFTRFFGKFPQLEEFLEKIESFLLAISKSLAGFIDALIEYINLIKQRIASLMAFIAQIKAIIDMLLNLRLPDTNIKYLLTRSRGTLGFVEDISTALEQPKSGRGIYSTYATLVFGSGLPQIVEDFILGFFNLDEEAVLDSFNNEEIDQLP